MTLFPLQNSDYVIEYSTFLSRICLWKRSLILLFIKALDIPFSKIIIKSLSSYIEKFGRITLERFQRIITFITRMGTPGTIESKTWNASTDWSILRCTTMKRECAIKSKEYIVLSLAQELGNGIIPKRAERFSLVLQKRDGRKENLYRGAA